MCVQHIENLKKDFNLPINVCPYCGGNGEIVTLCGHDVTEFCHLCGGKGYIRKDDYESTDK
jgi:DnaJ-class molecular chaperone